MKDNLFHRVYENTGLYQNGQALLVLFLASDPPSEIQPQELYQYQKWVVVFTKKQPASLQEAVGFVEKCENYLNNSQQQLIIWETETTNTKLFLKAKESQIITTEHFSGIITGQRELGVSIQVINGAEFDLTSDGQLKFRSIDNIYFNNVVMKIDSAMINLTGEDAGVFAVELPFSADELLNSLFPCGFEFGFRDKNQELILVSSSLYPEQKLNMTGRFLLDFNVFSGNRYVFEEIKNSDEQFLSNFRSLYGEQLYLKPIVGEAGETGLKFVKQTSKTVRATPYGRFQVMNAKGQNVKLLCGLAGTEYLETAGELEFIPDQPAYAPGFPATEFSIAQLVEPAQEQLLTEERVTSWVRFSGKYATQSLNAPFFQGSESVVTVADISRSYQYATPFPLMPVANTQLAIETTSITKNGRVVSEFQQQILSNERARILLQPTEALECVSHNDTSIETVATPSGFVAEMTNGQFEKISVAFPTKGELAFNRHTADGKFIESFPSITGAFQNPAMFMVMVNKTNTGDFGKKGITLNDWSFDLTPGKGSKYNEYSNVVIIKGCSGKIYDHEEAEKSLSGNSDRWTGKESFAQPEAGLGELANLSQWLMAYFCESYERYEAGDDAYKNFVEIIQNEDWKGLLALNVQLMDEDCKEKLPKCILPLLAAGNKISFNAHHLGVELVPLKKSENGPVNEIDSSFFGLIDYQAPGYYGKRVPITNSKMDYEFRLLKLKAQFENNVMKDFTSLSQFVLGKFMGLKPEVGGLLYHALLLKGSVQSVNGCNTLLLQTDGGDLNFAGPLMGIKITDVTMTTIDQKHFAFDFAGVMTFQHPAENTIDVFSYEQLQFANYRILLSDNIFTIVSQAMIFDLVHSTIRTQSLIDTFRLQPSKIRIGKNLAGDYHGLAIENFPIGDLKEEAGAIEFSAVLGGLGSLSADSCLNVKFLLGWNAAGEPYAGIHLPGQTMLQQVIELSLGDVRLINRSQNGKQNLVLFISQVALQLLGKLKLPPNGALNLAISGDSAGIGWFAAYEAGDSQKKGAANVRVQEG